MREEGNGFRHPPVIASTYAERGSSCACANDAWPIRCLAVRLLPPPLKDQPAAQGLTRSRCKPLWGGMCVCARPLAPPALHPTYPRRN